MVSGHSYLVLLLWACGEAEHHGGESVVEWSRVDAFGASGGEGEREIPAKACPL
jgi:hypothetical protein